MVEHELGVPTRPPPQCKRHLKRRVERPHRLARELERRLIVGRYLKPRGTVRLFGELAQVHLCRARGQVGARFQRRHWVALWIPHVAVVERFDTKQESNVARPLSARCAKRELRDGIRRHAAVAFERVIRGQELHLGRRGHRKAMRKKSGAKA